MDRIQLINEIRSILAGATNRGLTADEKAKIAQMEADISAIDEKREIEARAAKFAKAGNEVVDSVLTGCVSKQKTETAVRGEMRSLLNNIFRGNVTELRALAAMTEGTAANGGNSVTAQLLNEIIRKKRDLNPLWQYARVIPCSSSVLKVPVEGTQTLAGAFNEAAALGDSLTQPTINQLSITVGKIAHLVKISAELLEDNEVGIEEYMIQILAEAMAAKEEALMVAGTGGLAVATSVSSVAIGTEALGTTSVTATDLFNIFHGINAKYRQNAVWLMNDSTVKAIRLLTDSVAGQFIWQPGLQAGQPDMLLGRPVLTSASMPAMATGARSIVFFDASRFLIAQRRGMEFKRLEERFADTDEIGLAVSERLGYALALAEAAKVGVNA